MDSFNEWEMLSVAKKRKPVDYKVFYKITNKANTSLAGCPWGAQKTHVAEGQDLDNDILIDPRKWLHAYAHPVIAILLWYLHVPAFQKVNLWKCCGIAKYQTFDQKLYCTEITTSRNLVKPRIGHYTRMEFAIECVSKVYKDKYFLQWTKDWLLGYCRVARVAEDVRDNLQNLIKNDKSDEGNHHALVAAYYLAKAAITYSDKSQIHALGGVEYNVALTACVSSLSAEQLGIDFDMIKIAENVMKAN